VRAAALGLVAVGFALVLGASPAQAHRLAPSYLELRETGAGDVAVRWRTPRLVARGARLAPRLPCAPQGELVGREEPNARVLEGRLTCPSGLVGQEVGVQGLAGSGTDALLHVVFADGRTLDAILTAARPSLRIPAGEGAFAVVRSYGRLGVAHLLSGLDHVLFVLGLVALLRAGRPLVLAITAFTLGHSVTLAAASLGWVRMPAEPVEIAIAASLVALALALVRPGAGRRSLGPAGARESALVRRPAVLPFGFGLLHGLGFAGALTAAGLPQNALVLSLFSFNVGIELGQLAVVALALPVLAALRRLPLPTSAWFCELPATALGALGMYLVFDRAALWATF
jgi:hypothetical protein